jgi:hypothetical protein
MSQDKDSILTILNDPSFAKGFKEKITAKRIRTLMRTSNKIRSRDNTIELVNYLIDREPQLFSDLIGKGHSKEQIAKKYYDRCR